MSLRSLVPDKERRRWLKFVAKNEGYEKSVKFSGLVESFEAKELWKREVLMIAEPEYIGKSTIAFSRNGKPVKYESDHAWRFDGYYRLDTSRLHYPKCGTYGICDEDRSDLALRFRRLMSEGAAKRQRSLMDAQLKKIVGDTVSDIVARDKEFRIHVEAWRAKRARKKMKARSANIKSREVTSFFQMMGAFGHLSNFKKTKHSN